MIRTTYSEARANRRAAAKALRTRVRRLLAAAIVRFRNGADITAAIAGGALVTVGAHMRALGADEELARRFASHAGKKVKAAYETLHDAEPLRVWTVRNDRPIEVHAYAPTELALRLGLAAYNRTAHLVAA